MVDVQSLSANRTSWPIAMHPVLEMTRLQFCLITCIMHNGKKIGLERIRTRKTKLIKDLGILKKKFGRWAGRSRPWYKTHFLKPQIETYFVLFFFYLLNRYQIVIETGNCFNAGTTAGVSCLCCLFVLSLFCV